MATYSRDLTSNKNALDACEFYKTLSDGSGTRLFGLLLVLKLTVQKVLSNSSMDGNESINLCKTREKPSCIECS